MKYYIDSDKYLVGIEPVEGATEIDAPELEMPLSQYRWINNSWVLSDAVPQSIIDRGNEIAFNNAVNNVKHERLQKLKDSDWTDTFSAPQRLGNNLYSAWQDYRQQLRDITKQSGYPFNVIWPIQPE